MTPDAASRQSFTFTSADQTEDLARRFADIAAAGLTILLEGPVGAGKSAFARAMIQRLMRRAGAVEDVPSPTFTLVQTYEVGDLEIWHADLYRLTSPDELIELGLEAAFDTGLCLIEWPDRMEGLDPAGAVRITLSMGAQEGHRLCEVSGPQAWLARLDPGALT